MTIFFQIGQKHAVRIGLGSKKDKKSKEVEEEIDLWKEAALKCDYLLRELKRLGIEKNDNFACIVDMHQDITIPPHSEAEKELAGIPSTFTNIT